MCRLLGIISAEAIPYRVLLKEIPRSLSVLSKEHSDGWGLAVYRASLHADGQPSEDWALYKGIQSAERDESFHEISSRISGEILISHVRKRTVGPVSLENTHPFERDGWVFAHNGTLFDIESLRNEISPHQSNVIRGETDSEMFFALVLSKLEAEGLLRRPADARTDEVLRNTIREVQSRPRLQELTFLLSNGSTLYAYRSGPKLLNLLERGPHQGKQFRVAMEDGQTIKVPWTQRRHAFFLASEKITNEPWDELEEGALLRIDRIPQLSLRRL